MRQRSDELAASRTDAARWEAAHARAEGALLHNGPDSAADAPDSSKNGVSALADGIWFGRLQGLMRNF